MRFISWNVNGFRACLNKGFEDFFSEQDADFFCLQETKMQPEQSTFAPEGYHIYFNSAVKKGYSGTAVFAKKEPLDVITGICGKHDDEGRMIMLEYDDFYVGTSYSPNSQEGLARIDYRMEYEDDMREYLCSLKEKKSVILCGDLNVAHKEIDLKNPGPNRGRAGFSDEERDKFGKLLDAGFTDTFRYKYPDAEGIYSWWSYRFNARKNNAGWRIDYFIVSDDLDRSIEDAYIFTDVYGSDHCPVGVDISI